jgi:uncharacterized heparinase superfamily protein
MSILSKIGLYWHTLRHLKLSQIVWRLVFRFKKVLPDLSPPPALRTMQGPIVLVAHRAPSLIGRTKFIFLNEEGDLELDGWDNPQREKLWRYNQHYFDDLNARSAAERREWHRSLIARWIDENPPGEGTGWEPYPTSLRIVNWVKWSLLSEPLSYEAQYSLAVQARWLNKKIEKHLLGNHLFANAKALIIAGCFFNGREADDWLRAGYDILASELPEQILSDGGHFELSPMYHALAIEDVLDLINILRASGVYFHSPLIKSLEQKVEPMLEWLAVMSHPDDGIAFFNDAAFGIAPDNADLRDYAERLGFRNATTHSNFRLLKSSGYARMRSGPVVVFADVAEVGPSYLPGHAHADTLSFECSAFGDRVIVNSGTSVYGLSAERLRQRGTAAHTTVCIEEENSSDVWSGFRVARRATILNRRSSVTAEGLLLEASHDGYHRLARGLTHKRTWVLSENNLLIDDHLTKPQRADAIYHLHPDVQVEVESSYSGRLLLRNGQVLRWECSSCARIEAGTWHPQFGLTVPNRRIVAGLVEGKVTFRLFW